MLKAKKKLARKEIKQDTLVKLSSDATTYYYENKKYVNYAFMALLAVVALIYFYVKNRNDNNDKATSDLARVMSIYDAGTSDPAQFKIAIAGQPERGIKGLKEIVDSYGNSETGETARFYLANAYYYTSQYDLAMTQYDKYGGKIDILKAAAYAGMGGCYEVKREYAKAASAYEHAAGILANSGSTPDYLSLAARSYGMSGEKEKAVTLFKRIKKEFPTSAAARDVDRYIAQFSA